MDESTDEGYTTFAKHDWAQIRNAQMAPSGGYK